MYSSAHVRFHSRVPYTGIHSSILTLASANRKNRPMAFRHRLARLASRSETDLTSIDHVDDMRRSLLVVSKSTVRVGESIDVKWDVTVPCDPDDWIGICRAGAASRKTTTTTTTLFLLHAGDVPTLSTCPEIKNRGVNGARKGKISWTIASHVIPSSQSSSLFFQKSNFILYLFCAKARVDRSITTSYFTICPVRERRLLRAATL